MNQHLTPDCHSVIASALQRMDHTAKEMELKWGIGRLPLLVGDELRRRFHQQMALVDQALASDTMRRDEILAQINGMERAWRALDVEATKTAPPRPVTVWEAPNPDGGVFLIVQDNAAGSQVAVQAKERGCQVYTLDEIGRLLSRYPDIAKVKEVFPGAVVTSFQARTPTATLLNDDIPF